MLLGLAAFRRNVRGENERVAVRAWRLGVRTNVIMKSAAGACKEIEKEDVGLVRVCVLITGGTRIDRVSQTRKEQFQ